jgi:NAD(P)H-hydrate repair Nnr-like enzyme with NAD(P)H-hydrate dehydratase domain
VVLDAYALGALSKDAALIAGRPRRVVLTPNVTEAGHLLGRDPGDDLAAEARSLAERYDAVVSLYGHIAAPDGRSWREEGGDAGLGTSGSGDVRAGIVAGLLGRGAEPAQAACWAAFTHAVSGQRLIPRYGRTGFLARELVDEVASTIATI